MQLKELYVYLMVTASTTSNVNLELWYDANPVVAPARWASSMGYATGNLTLYAHAYIGSASKVLEVDYITGAVGAYVNYTSLLNGSLNHNIHPISYNNPPHLLYTEVKCINTIVIKSPQTTITLDSGKIVLRGVRA
ncbi:hypothetical protein SDC9_209216 [bioreactor metagenome]|uniref:Uncharacterized protein n=1 Tax=bioreactor metagenome TaxID=1076179 RepID=A0A645JFN1_9ZZZZ